MEKNINNQPHWRCRLCGYSSPLSASTCDNPSCGADLAIYGEAIVPGQEESRPREQTFTPPPPEPVPPKPEDRQKPSREDKRRAAEAARQQAAEEKRRAAEEKARQKEARRQSRGGRSKGLIAGVICLILVLGIGSGLCIVHFGSDFELPFIGQDSDRRSSDSSNSAGRGHAKPDESDDLPDEPDKSAEPAPVDPDGWKNNLMQADPFVYSEGVEEHYYPVFGTDVARTEIASITFMDDLNDPVFSRDCWDISESGDGSVLCRVSGSPGSYDMYIGGNGGVLAPASCAYLFSYYDNLRSVEFGDAFHTDRTSDMSRMFAFCQSLPALDLGGLDTSNVTNMNGMFDECTGLVDINVSGFDTSNVTSMINMFSNCVSLTSLDVTGFNTANVTDMFGMFSHCEGLTELDVSSFDTARVTDMAMMFCDCIGLKELDITNFKTANVTDMSFMFDDVDDNFVLHYSPENFDTSNVIDSMYFLPDTFDWEKMFA